MLLNETGVLTGLPEPLAPARDGNDEFPFEFSRFRQWSRPGLNQLPLGIFEPQHRIFDAVIGCEKTFEREFQLVGHRRFGLCFAPTSMESQPGGAGAQGHSASVPGIFPSTAVPVSAGRKLIPTR